VLAEQHYTALLVEPDPLLATLGRRTRQRRREQGLTLRELASRSGLSQRFLVQVESGLGNPSVRSLAGLARALGTSAAVLLEPEPEALPPPPAVALLGLRGAGKTSVGSRLAERLGIPFVELDRRIEESAGLSLGEIFALHGEGYYRRLERAALEALLEEGRPRVLATGGGLVTSPRTWSMLRRRALTVWLRARPEEHWNRVLRQGDRRPMADNPRAMSELRELVAVREPLYAGASHSVITSGRSIDAVVSLVERLVQSASGFGERRSSTSR
jgi:XRE family aerobic/anaerobic benzoate catabolism transcriptional regulator